MLRVGIRVALALSVAAVMQGPCWAKTSSFKAQCGNSTFEVTLENRGSTLENRYELRASSAVAGADRKLLYVSNEGGWFYAQCLPSAAAGGRSLLLFQAFCGGSACVEDRYGVVDADTLKLLLRPPKGNVGNAKAAAKVIGRKDVPYLPEDPKAFCCDQKQ